MKNKDLEKYIAELSPELLEKARQCRNRDELNRMLAENDVELSDDALAAVAGGGSCSDPDYTQGEKVKTKCPECGRNLYYWDRTSSSANRLYCSGWDCIAYKENWLFGYPTPGQLERVK